MNNLEWTFLSNFVDFGDEWFWFLSISNNSEAVCLVRCLGHSQLVSSLSPLVNKLFGGILSWKQTLIRSFTERQLSHKVHAYLIHNSCLTRSQGTKNTKKSSCPSHSQLVSSSFITHSQMTKHSLWSHVGKFDFGIFNFKLKFETGNFHYCSYLFPNLDMTIVQSPSWLLVLGVT
jgi:hypothetical protein